MGYLDIRYSLRSFLRKTPFSLQMKEKFATIDEIQNEVQSVGSLERIVQGNQKWVLQIVN